MKKAKFWIGIGSIVVMLAVLPLINPATSKPAPPITVPIQESVPVPVYVPAPAVPQHTTGVIEQAFRNRSQSLPVTEQGAVSRILSDDNEGSRHQRFIVRLASGHTVLIAHNIDLAPRINSLREGDHIIFSGLFEWNDKGGVVHWTHHDPAGRKNGGYLQHKGVYYR